jgi:hypothetical protein
MDSLGSVSQSASSSYSKAPKKPKDLQIIKGDWGPFNVFLREPYPGYGSLEGRIFHCSSVLNFASGGLSDWDNLKRAVDSKALNGPAWFTVEGWECRDQEEPFVTFKGTVKYHYSGVEWIDARHVSTERDECGGYAAFKYQDRDVVIWDGPTIVVPPDKHTGNKYACLHLIEHVGGQKDCIDDLLSSPFGSRKKRYASRTCDR